MNFDKRDEELLERYVAGVRGIQDRIAELLDRHNVGHADGPNVELELQAWRQSLLRLDASLPLAFQQRRTDEVVRVCIDQANDLIAASRGHESEVSCTAWLTMARQLIHRAGAIPQNVRSSGPVASTLRDAMKRLDECARDMTVRLTRARNEPRDVREGVI
jgi:hypothetical protein